jgi:hypothetical protein
MLVRLSPGEVKLACLHAAERYASAVSRGAKPKENIDQPEDRSATDFISCMAELAAAKGLNLYWSGVAGIGSNDVGPYEVRSTHHQNGKLVIYEKDRNDQDIVLVICNPPEFNVVGYINAKEGKKDSYKYTSPRGWCWMVPQGRLQRFENKIEQAPPMDSYERLFDLR